MTRLVPRQFAITWDYRCPYARIAHDHVLTGLRAGAPWDVTFLPFSLGQAHVEPGDPDVWDDPASDSGIIALQVAVAVRDLFPASFPALHHALFEYRHAHHGNLRDLAALSRLVQESGAEVDKTFAHVDDGAALATIKDEHESFARSHHVWGVPTFIVGDAAVFVRLMEPAGGDAELARATVERVLDQVAWPLLNELKHTSIPR